MKSIKLHLVVAACQSNRGIGINGTLPWRIPEDMKFLRRITMETEDSSKRNAVVMGRKTWESIPDKFRPLMGRLNVIVSTSLKDMPPGTLLARSFEDAVELLRSQDDLENMFVLGGASVYKTVLESPYCGRLYLTEVMKDFDCDTFLPEFDIKDFKTIEVPGIPTAVQMHHDIPFKFTVYEKIVQS